MRRAALFTMANPYPPEERPRVSELLHDIGHDVRTIAGDEIALVRHELTSSVRHLLVDAVGTALGATVALIGLGFLCTAAVAGLAPVIPPLWLRLVIMAVIYVLLGALAAYRFAEKLRDDSPSLDASARGARNAVDAVKHGLEH